MTPFQAATLQKGIVGTYETGTGVALIDRGEGSPKSPEYEGTTEGMYENQSTVTHSKHGLVYVDSWGQTYVWWHGAGHGPAFRRVQVKATIKVELLPAHW